MDPLPCQKWHAFRATAGLVHANRISDHHGPPADAWVDCEASVTLSQGRKRWSGRFATWQGGKMGFMARAVSTVYSTVASPSPFHCIHSLCTRSVRVATLQFSPVGMVGRLAVVDAGAHEQSRQYCFYCNDDGEASDASSSCTFS
nr:hypothetical protein CFP56_43933 [Quercus suber]